jgi:hypothetical protein
VGSTDLRSTHSAPLLSSRDRGRQDEEQCGRDPHGGQEVWAKSIVTRNAPGVPLDNDRPT